MLVTLSPTPPVLCLSTQRELQLSGQLSLTPVSTIARVRLTVSCNTQLRQNTDRMTDRLKDRITYIMEERQKAMASFKSKTGLLI